jgi:uncharacterized protein (TIGR03086 family)
MTMSEISEQFAKIAGQFTERALAVPEGAWDNPAPCDGWVARDVVRHMVEWMPSLVLDPYDLARPNSPEVDDDPAGAWVALCTTLQAGLDDPEIAVREADIFPGRFTFEQAVSMFVTADVFVHTWDLARATGLDETLDPAEVHRYFAAAEPFDEMLRQSGQYGARVAVPDDAEEQTRFIAFMGRRP